MRRLFGTAEAATVIGDDPETRIVQCGNLRCPRLAGQRPAVDQNDGTTGTASIFHMELNAADPLYA